MSVSHDKSGAATQVPGPGDVSSKQTGPSGASLKEIESAFGPEVKLIALSDCVVVRFGLALGALPLHCQLASCAVVTEVNVAAVGCGGGEGVLGVGFFPRGAL